MPSAGSGPRSLEIRNAWFVHELKAARAGVIGGASSWQPGPTGTRMVFEVTSSGGTLEQVVTHPPLLAVAVAE
jgi:hypothetical protein